MGCSPLPGYSLHGISQARVLEWVVTSFSQGNSWPRDQTHVSCIGFFTTKPSGKPTAPLLLLRYTKNTSFSGTLHFLFLLPGMIFTQTNLKLCIHMIPVVPSFIQILLCLASLLPPGHLIREASFPWRCYLQYNCPFPHLSLSLHFSLFLFIAFFTTRENTHVGVYLSVCVLYTFCLLQQSEDTEFVWFIYWWSPIIVLFYIDEETKASERMNVSQVLFWRKKGIIKQEGEDKDGNDDEF